VPAVRVNCISSDTLRLIAAGIGLFAKGLRHSCGRGTIKVGKDVNDTVLSDPAG